MKKKKKKKGGKKGEKKKKVAGKKWLEEGGWLSVIVAEIGTLDRMYLE